MTSATPVEGPGAAHETVTRCIYARHDGHDRLELETTVECSQARLWQAVVDPAQRAVWFFAGVLDPRPEGLVALVENGPGITGRVVTVDAPRAMLLDWSSLDGPDSQVSFRLESDGAGATLRLSHHLNDRCRPDRLAAGWHAILDDLAEFVRHESVTSRPDRHARLTDRYRGYATT